MLDTIIISEYDFQLLSQCYSHFPTKIEDADWKMLLNCETQKARFNHIKFCRIREHEQEKDVRRRQLRSMSKPSVSKGDSKFSLIVGTAFISTGFFFSV